MKFYLYDEKTKQFITEQEGYLDPSETKAPDNSDAQLPPTNRGPVVDEKEYSPKNV